jgi:polar amino acid transport system substrate-binding protein
MKNLFKIFLTAIPVFLFGCSEQKSENQIKFAVSAEYPPFEYYEKGELTGFDIELAKLIAKELGKECVFENMTFSTILAAIKSGTADAGISTITITEERKQNIDFSDPYYTESLSMVYHKNNPIDEKAKVNGRKIACQMGSTMEIWLKTAAKNVQLTAMDHNNQAIEALKSGLVEGVLVDSVQAVAFCEKNPGLAHAVIAKADTGYGIALQKGSPLTAQINQALKVLITKGELQKLIKKWLSK